MLLTWGSNLMPCEYVPKKWREKKLYEHLGIKTNSHQARDFDRAVAGVNELLDKATPIETEQNGYTYSHGIKFEPQVSSKGLIYFRQTWTRIKVL